MTASAWLRAVRARFLLASVVAVSAGLAAAAWRGAQIDAASAALTMAGVLALHASVDLLNDYADHKRGIDARARRTPMSGGTGVIADGLLAAGQVRRAGVCLLLAGCAAGAYFALAHGWVIAAILGFAAASIWFYSTRIVDSGLAEAFVAAKGALIVVGAAYIQEGILSAEAALVGAAVGALSSAVLFVASFPDHEADAAGGRRTLVIAAGGPARAAPLFWAFPAAALSALAAGAWAGVLPALPLAAAAAGGIPLAAAAGLRLRASVESRAPGAAESAGAGDRTPAGIVDWRGLVGAMSATLLFARASGALLVAGLVVATLLRA